MSYLGRAFKIFGKKFLLFIPLFVIAAVLSILCTPANVALNNWSEAIKLIPPETITQQMIKESFMEVFMLVLPGLLLALGVFCILALIVFPGLFGALKCVLQKGDVGFIDFFIGVKQNIIKFILYILAWIPLGIIIFLIYAVGLFLLGLISNVSPALSAVLMFLFVIIFMCLCFTLYIMLTLWFPAMVIDNLDLFGALKKSLAVSKEYLWPMIGQNLLVLLIYLILVLPVNLVMNAFPIPQAVVSSAIVSIYWFITMAYSMVVYYERTEREVKSGVDTELNEF